jgi:hypothetical protein
MSVSSQEIRDTSEPSSVIPVGMESLAPDVIWVIRDRVQRMAASGLRRRL